MYSLTFFFFSAQMAFQEDFFVPQLTQTTKKLLLLNIACCWGVFWNYTPFFKGTEELRTSRAFTSMANTESSRADWMQLFTNQLLTPLQIRDTFFLCATFEEFIQICFVMRSLSVGNFHHTDKIMQPFVLATSGRFLGEVGVLQQMKKDLQSSALNTGFPGEMGSLFT